MKSSRNSIRTALSITLFYCSLTTSAYVNSSDVGAEGKEFRTKIEAAFKAEKTFHRFYDVTDVCRNSKLEGRTVDEVNNLLRAAGQKFNLEQAGGSTARPDDLVGGFSLVSGLTYGSALTITLQAPFPAKNGTRTVASVRQCLIVSTSL